MFISIVVIFYVENLWISLRYIFAIADPVAAKITCVISEDIMLIGSHVRHLV